MRKTPSLSLQIAAPPGGGWRRNPAWIAAAAAFVFIWTMTTHGKFSAAGDEPHYLMIAESLLSDGDFDLANNYARNDGRMFGQDRLGVGLHAIRSRTGSMLSIHDPGLAVFVTPIYAVARLAARFPSDGLLKRVRMTRGLFAYSIVSVSLAAITCLGFVLLGRALAPLTGASGAGAIVFVALISPPVSSHAFLVFPEVLALLVTNVSVWFALREPSERDAGRVVALAALLGLLPWTHHKFVFYSFGLAVAVAAYRQLLLKSLTRRQMLSASIAFIAPQILLVVWSVYEWGSPGGAISAQVSPFSFEAFKSGAAGLLIDRQSGLLAYGLVYWIVPGCLMLAWRRTWVLVVPIMLLYIPAASFVVGWWAGFSPAARYLVPAVPLMLVSVALALRYPPIRWAAILLTGPQLAIDAVLWQHPRWLWPATDHNLAVEALGLPGDAYATLLPRLVDSGLTAQALMAIGALIAFSGGLAALASWWPKPADRQAPV